MSRKNDGLVKIIQKTDDTKKVASLALRQSLAIMGCFVPVAAEVDETEALRLAA